MEPNPGYHAQENEVNQKGEVVESLMRGFLVSKMAKIEAERKQKLKSLKEEALKEDGYDDEDGSYHKTNKHKKHKREKKKDRDKDKTKKDKKKDKEKKHDRHKHRSRDRDRSNSRERSRNRDSKSESRTPSPRLVRIPLPRSRSRSHERDSRRDRKRRHSPEISRSRGHDRDSAGRSGRSRDRGTPEKTSRSSRGEASDSRRKHEPSLGKGVPSAGWSDEDQDDAPSPPPTEKQQARSKLDEMEARMRKQLESKLKAKTLFHAKPPPITTDCIIVRVENPAPADKGNHKNNLQPRDNQNATPMKAKDSSVSHDTKNLSTNKSGHTEKPTNGIQANITATSKSVPPDLASIKLPDEPAKLPDEPAIPVPPVAVESAPPLPPLPPPEQPKLVTPPPEPPKPTKPTISLAKLSTLKLPTPPPEKEPKPEVDPEPKPLQRETKPMVKPKIDIRSVFSNDDDEKPKLKLPKLDDDDDDDSQLVSSKETTNVSLPQKPTSSDNNASQPVKVEFIKMEAQVHSESAGSNGKMEEAATKVEAENPSKKPGMALGIKLSSTSVDFIRSGMRIDKHGRAIEDGEIVDSDEVAEAKKEEESSEDEDEDDVGSESSGKGKKKKKKHKHKKHKHKEDKKSKSKERNVAETTENDKISSEDKDGKECDKEEKSDKTKDSKREKDKKEDSKTKEKDKKDKDEKGKEKKDKDSKEKDKKSHKRSHSRKHSRSRSRSRSPDRRKSRKYRESRSRSRSRDRRRGSSRDRSRHRSRSREYDRFWGSARRDRYRRSPSPKDRKRDRGSERDSDLRMRIDKAKLRKIAIANAVANMQSGQGPNLAIKSDDLAAIKAGGRSVEELTNFCKKIAAKDKSKRRGDSDSDMSSELSGSDDDDKEAGPFINHPFRLQDKSIVMNIKDAKQLPVMTPAEKISSGLHLAFPVSSGSQHRDKESEWVPVAKTTGQPTTTTPTATATASITTPPAPGPQLAIAPPPPPPVPAPAPALAVALPPIPGIPEPPKPIPEADKVFPDPPSKPLNIGALVSERLSAMRKLQENPNDVVALKVMYKAQKEMNSWAQGVPGQFTGSTGVKTLSQQELAPVGKYQAWAKKNTLTTAAPLKEGIGMALLQKMGWKQGEGLGKNRDGSSMPLMLDVKMDRKGLFTQEEAKGKMVKMLPQTSVNKGLSGKHPVSALVELCTKKHWKSPEFILVNENGPAHQKHFLYKVQVNNWEYMPACGSNNKKTAKAEAATVCLQELGLLPKS